MIKITPNTILDSWGKLLGATSTWMVKTAESVGETMDRVAWFTPADFRNYFQLGTWDRLGGRSYHAIALVTDGTGEAGTAICKSLSVAGYTVVATYPHRKQGFAQAWRLERLNEGLHIALVECDISDFDACGQMAREVRRRFGGVDVLVNCADILPRLAPTMQQTQCHPVVETSLDGIFNATKNIIGGMMKRHRGKIINIPPALLHPGEKTDPAVCSVINASTVGVISFSRSLAREVAGHGIAVTAICPTLRAVPSDSTLETPPGNPMGETAEERQEAWENLAQRVVSLLEEAEPDVTGAEAAVKA
jgi:acetoacetyl-CoA reductase